MLNTVAQARERLSRNVWIAGLVSLFTDISSEMIIPVLPLFLSGVLGAPVSAIGLIEGIAEAMASLMKAVSGYLSDRMGRRKPLMALGYGLSNMLKPPWGSPHRGARCWQSGCRTDLARGCEGLRAMR